MSKKFSRYDSAEYLKTEDKPKDRFENQRSWCRPFHGWCKPSGHALHKRSNLTVFTQSKRLEPVAVALLPVPQVVGLIMV